MSVELIYKHQRKTYDLMKDALREGGRAAYVFPMGGGKSFLPLKYMEENPDKKVLLVSPNIGIINQFKGYISKYLLDGKKATKRTFPNFRAITYQKVALAQDVADLKPDVIIFDEIHRMGAENWEPAIDKLIEANPNAQIIGMSATPERTDKRNMAYEKFGKSVVYEMSLTEALSGSKEDEVVLNGARYARVISTLRNEIDQYKKQIDLIEDEGKRQRLLKKFEELNSIVASSPDISDIMASAMQKKNGKYIVFCSNREEMFEQMKKVQEIFGKVNSNINVDYIITRKGKTGKSQRENRRTLEEFEKRDRVDALNLLFCVDMLNEGVHLEGIDGEIQFKPTESRIRYKQMVGRVLSSDKTAEETVIIDAVNNWLRQIDTYRELEGAVSTGDRIEGEKSTKHKKSNLLSLTNQELELVDVLQEIREELSYQTNNTFDEVIRWLETHDGEMPHGYMEKDGRKLTSEELTDEQRHEKSIYVRWSKCKERKALTACGLGIPTYEALINWLKTHNGRTPRGMIVKNKKRLKTSELTREEQYERNLYYRMSRLPEYVAYKKTKGIPIDDLPEEYLPYKEQIITLREFEQMRTSRGVLQRMRESVGKQILSNESARTELSGLTKGLKENRGGQGK